MPKRQHLLFLHLTSQQLKTKGSETLFLWILSFYSTPIHLPYLTPPHTHTVPRRYKRGKPSSGFASLELEFPGFPGGSVVNNPPANAGDAGDSGLSPGSGRSPGEGSGNPLQCSCLGNLMDRGAWGAYSPGGHKRVGRNVATKQQQLLSLPPAPVLLTFPPTPWGHMIH